MRPIPYGHQHIDDVDVAEVVAVLRSEFITQGPAIERFERAVADYCGARHAVAVANGTAGLHLAALALRLGPGDCLWSSANTFAATANCARYCGADVGFVDIDPGTYNMSVDDLERRLEAAAPRGRLPTVVAPVHFAGQPCDMPRIGALARRYGFRVVEDACHAVGSTYAGARTGGCGFSDMVVFSFHPVKVITTGEGGMVLTNDDDLHRRLRLLRTHGITRDPAQMHDEPHGPWYYEQIDLGFNYRLTDIQAALGCAQMRRLDAFVRRRQEIAARYDERLADLPLRLPARDPAASSSFHLYVVRVDGTRCPRSRHDVFADLRADGVQANVHYIPVYKHPYYRRLGYEAGDYPETERYYEEAITLPMYVDLDERDQDRVVEALRRACA